MHAKPILLGLVLLTVLFVSAEGGGIEYTVIYNCYDSPELEICTYVVGQIYKFSEIETGGVWIRFPETPIPKQLVKCQDPTAVTLAKYTNGQWVPITSDVVSDPLGVGIQVEALVDSLGTFAIIQKNEFTMGSDYEGMRCERLDCGDVGAFITDPYNVFVDANGMSLQTITAGNEITLSFCGMLAGCRINSGDRTCDTWERHCQQGIAPTIDRCPAVCTAEPGDCCYPASGDDCDTDCYIERNLETDEIIFSTDPDCLDENSNALNIPPTDITLKFRAPDEDDGDWIEYSISPEKSHRLIEGPEDGGLPGFITGAIRFRVGDSDGDRSKHIWIGNFRYLDFNGDWHYLHPASQLPTGPTLEDFADASLLGGYDGSFDGNELGVQWKHPHVFLQSAADWDKPQYWFLNTPVKEIRFEAHSAECCDSPWDEGDTDDITDFLVQYNVITTEFDPDGDGASSAIDCNDNNPNIYPGAPEKCNGIDDNCNSWVPDKDAPTKPPINIYLDSKDSTPGVGTDAYHQTRSIRMPCDGFIKFEDIKPMAYAEVKRVDAFNQMMSEEDDSANSRWHESYSLEGFFGFNRSTLKNNDEIKEYFRYNKPVTTDFRARHQAILFYSAIGFLDAGAWNGVVDRKCIVGMEDSCTCQHVRDPTDETGDCPYTKPPEDRDSITYESTFVRDAGIWSGSRMSKSEILSSSIELLKGDIIKMWINSEGRIDFDIHCYQERQDGSLIDDEGCTIGTATVHVCKTDGFSQQNRQCKEGNWCSPITVSETTISVAPNAIETEIAVSCKIQTTEAMKEIQTFYVYVCPDDTGEECYRFYNNGMFRICSTKEVCGDGLDNDCDGTTDREDQDCAGACFEGECDIKDKKWCTNSEWKSEDYCLRCGHADSTCGKACAADEESCDGGCREGACDYAADLACAGGVWTEANYAAKCREQDSELGTACKAGSCDTEHDKTCFEGNWLTEALGAYCLRDCGPKDEGCHEKRKELGREPHCEAPSCDIHADQYCTAQHEWTGQNYCRYCGAIDSTCGPKACTEMVIGGTGERDNCDYMNQKYCKNGEWKTEGYCAIENCGADPQSQQICACVKTAEKEEGDLCQNRLDDDCDGYLDCADKDCDPNLPGCRCEEGEEKTCYADPLKIFGLCDEQKGAITCTNNLWTTCTGAFQPEIETCNSYDDDCDGSTDEGCNCKTGQTRNCGIDRGACGAGVQECDETGKWSICFGTGYRSTSPEECDDGIDNDCNGEIDEGCGCKEGEEQQCGTTDVGECEFGTQKCIGGIWGACLGGKDKMSEVGSQCMDGKDNDCDGKTDSEDENCGATPESELLPQCYDAIQNQGEEETDCGGPCEPCSQVTCNDRQKNGDEEGRDCGGTRGCPPCRGREVMKAEAEEKEEYEEETFEEVEIEEKGLTWLYIIGGVIILGVLFLLYNKYGKKAAPTAEKKPGIFPVKAPIPKQAAKPAMPIKQRITKTKEESTLEKSFEEAKKLFKK